MAEFKDNWQAWLDFVLGPRTDAAGPAQADQDDSAFGDLDFLDESFVWHPQGQSLAPLSAPTTDRAKQRQQLGAEVDGILEQLSDHWLELSQDPRLASIDADGLWLILQAMLLLPSCGLPSRQLLAQQGPLALAIEKAISSKDAEIALLGLGAAQQLRVSALQLAVAERLDADLDSLGHHGVEVSLSFLESCGDGRCIRAMEQLLHRHGLDLSEAHAFRARHLVQVIRRGGRK